MTETKQKRSAIRRRCDAAYRKGYLAGQQDAKIALAPLCTPADELSHMRRISELRMTLAVIEETFGDTCVYIRRGGLSWGAVALNRRSDDERNGTFDLQATHDRDMAALAAQIERLKLERDELRTERDALRDRIGRPILSAEDAQRQEKAMRQHLGLAP